MEERLRYRMYFFVPYNISPIQQAIQAGHSALEYAHEYGNNEDYLSFINNDKTWIILNGGTTNKGYETNPEGKLQLIGSLNRIHYDLCMMKINNHGFWEPDLNDALTAVCFLASEKVWDFEKYPDFENAGFDITSWNYASDYNMWVEHMGEKNLFLRELIRNKKLA